MRLFPIYFPIGNLATGFFVVFALLAGVVGISTSITGLHALLHKWLVVPVANHLFVPVLEPGQGGFCPGWQNRDKRCLTLKIFLHTTGFDPKTSYLAHGFLTNSPK